MVHRFQCFAPPPQSTSLIGKKMSCHTGLLSVVRKHSMCSAQAYSLKKILGLRGIDEVPISPAWQGLLAWSIYRSFRPCWIAPCDCLISLKASPTGATRAGFFIPAKSLTFTWKTITCFSGSGQKYETATATEIFKKPRQTNNFVFEEKVHF